MTKHSYFLLVLIGITLLLTGFAIMVLFTPPAFAGMGIR